MFGNFLARAPQGETGVDSARQQSETDGNSTRQQSEAGRNRPEKLTPEQEDTRRTNRFFAAFLTLGLLFVLSHKYNNPAVYISTALMWVLSCMASGAAVGFLFGIPKIYQGNRPVVERVPDAPPAGGQPPPPQPSAPPAGSRAGQAPPDGATGYRQEVNTNLTEISDWLTKIIVGLGLINLAHIPAYLDRMAGSLADGLNPAAAHAEKGFAFALITCFSVFGFLFGYIYTRVYLSVIFSRSDQAALAKAEQANSNAELAIDKVKEVSRLAEQVSLAAETANAAAAKAQEWALGTGKSKEQPGVREAARAEDDLGDPLKGKFGGKSENNDRKLDAEVLELPGVTDLFTVRLRVFSTKPEEKPLSGVVQFFLHPTFNNDHPVVAVDPDGVAELRLTAYGAFTVGALADDGKTKLELNLAELKDAPETFRLR